MSESVVARRSISTVEVDGGDSDLISASAAFCFVVEVFFLVEGMLLKGDRIHRVPAEGWEVSDVPCRAPQHSQAQMM